jgi:hypothetical protein
MLELFAKTFMTNLLLAAVVLLSACASASGQAQQPTITLGPEGPKVIVIDGSKDPSAIPQWLAWQRTFHALNSMQQGHFPVWDMPDKESEISVAAARAAVAAEGRCNTELTKRMDSVKSSYKPDALWAENKRLIVGCRQETLDHADRLIERLSPQGRQALLAWLEDRRRSTTSYVFEKEMAFYRSPR